MEITDQTTGYYLASNLPTAVSPHQLPSPPCNALIHGLVLGVVQSTARQMTRTRDQGVGPGNGNTEMFRWKCQNGDFTEIVISL